jgi:6-phosphofructokinase 1
LIPEVPFHTLTLLRHIKHRLSEKGFVVIVVAEGAAVHLGSSGEKDKSGNPVLLDIGAYLKKQIQTYFCEEQKEVTLKYIDPTYM